CFTPVNSEICSIRPLYSRYIHIPIIGWSWFMSRSQGTLTVPTLHDVVDTPHACWPLGNVPNRPPEVGDGEPIEPSVLVTSVPGRTLGGAATPTPRPRTRERARTGGFMRCWSRFGEAGRRGDCTDRHAERVGAMAKTLGRRALAGHSAAPKDGWQRGWAAGGGPGTIRRPGWAGWRGSRAGRC